MRSVRAIILGAGGQLGGALTRALPTATALSRAEFDLTDPEALDWSAYDTVLNAAAYTKVDQAETERAEAWAANAVGPAALARIATQHDLRLVHVSTEYVFDGAHEGPIPEDSPFSPLSTYGASKAAGDVAVATTPRHWIVRPTWVVGDGGNFARTMRTLAERGISPTVVADQIGRPTLAGDLATGILGLLDADPGTYHLTNSGPVASWAEIARFVFSRSGRDAADVTEATTEAYFADKPAAAPRPLNSVLDLTKAEKAGVTLPDWRESLEAYLS